ncbi:MAG: hypothetical protein LKM35_07485 [Lachnospiraceae bacterium]|jgi:hypothetical protein|nr:hypothetical protein [Lachnospiraceae bacterium]
MERQQKLDHVYSQLLGVMNNTPGGIVAFDTINNRKLVPVFVSQGLGRLLRGTEEQLSAAYKSDPLRLHPSGRQEPGRAHRGGFSAQPFGFQDQHAPPDDYAGDYVRVSATATVDTQENQ